MVRGWTNLDTGVYDEENYGVKQNTHRGNKREITIYRMRWGKARAYVILSTDNDALNYPSRYSVLQEMWGFIKGPVDKHIEESIADDWQRIFDGIESGDSVPVMKIVTPNGKEIDLFQ